MIGPFPIRVALGHVGPPLLLFLLLFVGHPFRDVFSFNPDESNNLMKAQLVAAGHSLFSDIWSDQPAVFTYMLRHWMDFTAWTVEQARILVLLCSCVLIWSFYQVVRRTASHVGAALACLLLVTSHQYLYLSASVMLAIPSLMFAVLSLHAALMQQQRGGLLWPTVSGACLALAIFAKMWTAMIIPVIALALYIGCHRATGSGRETGIGRPMAMWAISLLLTCAALFFATVPLADAALLVQPHLDGRPSHLMGNLRKFIPVYDGQLALVALAVIGSLGAIRRRTRIGLVPVVWAVIACAILLNHQPLRQHHHVIIAIPLAWCAGMAASAFPFRRCLQSLRSRAAGATTRATCLGLAALVIAGLTVTQARNAVQYYLLDWRDARFPAERALLEAIRQRADRTRWMITDQQIFAFYASIDVPPDLAVTSMKRVRAGLLTERHILDALETYTPEQVHVSGRRIEWTGSLETYLASRYVPVHDGPAGTLHIRKDIEHASPRRHGTGRNRR